MRSRTPVLIAVSLLTVLTLGGGVSLAHHSTSATYIFGQTVTIEGTLKELIWRNPHSFMRVEAPDDKGMMQSWMIEGAAPGQLAEQGLTAGTLLPGNHVIVKGRPSRVAKDHRVLLETLERPSDGFKWRGPAAAPE